MQPSYPPRGHGGFVHPVTAGKPHSYAKSNQTSAGVLKCKNGSIRKSSWEFCSATFFIPKGRQIDLKLACWYSIFQLNI